MGNNRQKAYRGGSAFIEIGARDIPMRITANVEHITSIMFSQEFEEDAETGAPVFLGYKVVIGIAGMANRFDFHDAERVVAFYNDLIAKIQNIGVPISKLPALRAAPPPDAVDSEGESAILDARGRQLAREMEHAANAEPDDGMPGLDSLDDLYPEELPGEEPLEPETTKPSQH